MKYIVEFEDEPTAYEDGMTFYACKQIPYWSMSKGQLNRLTPYIEPDRKAIEDEVWEFVSMLMNMHPDVAEDIYWSMNGGKGIGVAAEMTYQEAKARYDAWKKEKEEIRIGDEVEYEYGGEKIRFIVTGVKYSIAYGFRQIMEYEDVSDVGEYCDVDALQKTGRHFPEVAELLKKMRNSDD